MDNTLNKLNFKMEITKEELDVKITEGNLVVVDFWASWCGPCRLMKPVFEKLAEDNPGIAIHTVSAENNEGVGQIYGLRTIPAFVFFKGGVEVDRLMGRQTLDALQNKVDEHV